MAGKVTCNPPKGKKGYTVNFRHPVEKDKTGKYGLKVHRGLGTDDGEEAQMMAIQLEKMLNDDYWWDHSKKDEAYSKYSAVVVDAFYDPMENIASVENEMLDRIYLPGKEDGYNRSTIIGPSGYGKTSLVRMIAGTIEEKFPTTSTGRTTTCNMEIIMGNDGVYEVVITFMSRHLVEMYIQECIEAALEYCIHSSGEYINRKDISDKLFVHRDLILRLSYILGDLTLKQDENESDQFDFDEEDNLDENEINAYEFQQDKEALLERINYFIDEIIKIAENLTNDNLLMDAGEYNLEDNEEVLSLRNEIADEVAKRFNLLKKGEKINSKGKWVNAWYYKTNSRNDFIKTIKMFSSNAKNAWGGLLTPVVKTMRVKGDFAPGFEGLHPKIVLFDGLGLGHKTTATSLPSEIVEHFKISDSIIIVDNAQSPMLDNIKMALKAVIEYGYSSKIAFTYTHVDLMKGDNLRKFDDKRRHVLAALSSYLFELRRQNEDIFSDVEAEKIINASYFFSDLDKTEPSKMTKQYTKWLIDYFKTILSENITSDDVKLRYDAMTLYSHLQLGIQKYRKEWSKVIGYPSKSEKTEHWSRIKALTRRLAYFDMDNYNNELMPLADFRQEISSQLNLFMNKPLEVLPEETKEEVAVDLINRIKRDINAQLVDFVKEHMWKESNQLARWEEAYKFSGRDSTFYRSAKINEIFEISAPQIDNFAYNMTDIQKRYVMEIITMVEEALKKYGCILERFNY